MSTATVESLLQQFNTLPPSEQVKFRHLISDGLAANEEPVTAPVTLKLDAKDEASMRWIAANEQFYVGEWIALDGDRLIAHSANHNEVVAAARADGAELPLIYFAEPQPIRPFLRV